MLVECSGVEDAGSFTQRGSDECSAEEPSECCRTFGL